MFYKIKYFSKSNGLRGSDFENAEKSDWINSNHIISISAEPQEFRLPLSGDKKGEYGYIEMINGLIYYITPKELHAWNSLMKLKLNTYKK